jgi:hypothetical protein
MAALLLKIAAVPQQPLARIRKSARWKPRIMEKWRGRTRVGFTRGLL